MLGVWDSITNWLLSDAAATPLKPLDGEYGSVCVADAVNGNVHRRRAPQGSETVRPYVLVTGPDDYDNGTHSTGVMSLKIAQFNVIVVSDQTVSDIAPVVTRIKSIMERVRGEQVGDWWVNNFQLVDMDESEAESGTNGEAGWPAIVMVWRSGFYYQPVESP